MNIIMNTLSVKCLNRCITIDPSFTARRHHVLLASTAG